MSGGVLRLFSFARYGFYLFLMISYATGWPPLPPGRLPLVMGLLLALALIGVVLCRGLRSRTVSQGLVAAEVVLIFAIGVLIQARGLFAILYFITVAEAVFAFARPMPVVAACYALLGINLALATPAPFFWAVAGPLLGYAPGFAAFAGLSLLVAEHDRGRREIATLYQRLEEAHRELQRHAAQVEQLTVVRERARLAQEVHDTVAHVLTGIIVQIDAGRRLMREQPDRAAEALGKAEAQARAGLEEVRRTVQALRPEALEAAGGLAAMRRLAQEFQDSAGITVALQTHGPARPLPAAAEVVLYRALQEALTNAARHGQARRVEVALRYTGEGAELRIADDGRGSDIVRPGAGLSGIAERAESLGGWSRFDGQAGKGFQVTVFVPAQATEASHAQPPQTDPRGY
jgi:signal transduction histidine kinase